MKKHLLLQNISSGYKNNKVLKDINFTIKKNSLTAVIGPNGSGKSTLLKTIAGILKPEKGIIVLDNKNLHNFSPLRRAKEISIVHQNIEVSLDFSVYEFLLMAQYPYQKLFSFNAINEEIIEKALNQTGLVHLKDKNIRKISGGELQLAYIAHSLVQDCDIILLDEPISHLDIHHAIEIMDLLHSLKKLGKTILVVLHDINIASDYCDMIIAIKNGSLFFQGIPDDVVHYENIESLFETKCVVTKNPISGRPFTYPLPGYTLHKQ